MIELTPQSNQFRVQVKDLLQKHTVGVRSRRVERHSHIYTSGERDTTVYFIESGQIKLLLPTPEGKECLLAIRAAGEIFGEMCLSGQAMRLETAVAMENVTIKQVLHRDFIASLKNASLLEGLVQYLAVRISEQQEVIGAMATASSEQRLAKTLLSLGQRMGRNESGRLCIDYRISHEELSEIVGTTRPRVGIFLKKFRELGLILVNGKRRLVIDEQKLHDYIRRNSLGEKTIEPHHRNLDSGEAKSYGLVPRSAVTSCPVS